mgnify:CR=1 FL=1
MSAAVLANVATAGGSATAGTDFIARTLTGEGIPCRTVYANQADQLDLAEPTVKIMTVITAWPGATAQEMQDQVADLPQRPGVELRLHLVAVEHVRRLALDELDEFGGDDVRRAVALQRPRGQVPVLAGDLADALAAIDRVVFCCFGAESRELLYPPYPEFLSAPQGRRSPVGGGPTHVVVGRTW